MYTSYITLYLVDSISLYIGTKKYVIVLVGWSILHYKAAHFVVATEEMGKPAAAKPNANSKNSFVPSFSAIRVVCRICLIFIHSSRVWRLISPEFLFSFRRNIESNHQNRDKKENLIEFLQAKFNVCRMAKRHQKR